MTALSFQGDGSVLDIRNIFVTVYFSAILHNPAKQPVITPILQRMFLYLSALDTKQESKRKSRAAGQVFGQKNLELLPVDLDIFHVKLSIARLASIFFVRRLKQDTNISEQNQVRTLFYAEKSFRHS
jgi:hypothetical protein